MSHKLAIIIIGSISVFGIGTGAAVAATAHGHHAVRPPTNAGPPSTHSGPAPTDAVACIDNPDSWACPIR